jgi:DNA-directed RNA polymerase subunit RPC12/RpoP
MLLTCPRCQSEVDAADPARPGVCPECGGRIPASPLTDAIADFVDSDIEERPRRKRAAKTCPMCGVKNRRTAIKCRACGETFEAADEEERVRPNPLGIASFVTTLIAAAVLFASFAYAAVVGTQARGNIDAHPVALVTVGLGVIGGLMLDLVGVVLGIVALFLPGRGKIFAAIGTAIGGVILLGVLFLIAVGLAMQPPGRRFGAAEAGQKPALIMAGQRRF